ncbi:hypothetical protein HK096_002574 [Nowakowskiella sp. JEL0078]|nr:hypothetical protein HK096_002574 [Nowakowskiella sp. JEL0078]
MTNGVDDDVLGAAKVLFGHSYMNLRNFTFPTISNNRSGIDDLTQAGNSSESTTSPISSPEANSSDIDSAFRARLLSWQGDAELTGLEQSTIKKFGLVKMKIEESLLNKRRRKPPKRYDEGTDDENQDGASGSLSRVKGAKRAKIIKPKKERSPTRKLRFSNSPSTEGYLSSFENDASTTPSPTKLSEGFDFGIKQESASPPKKSSTSSKKSRRCDYCNATTTPMWRHGPVGYDDLCNKCGVKWMRGRILGNLTRAPKLISFILPINI